MTTIGPPSVLTGPGLFTYDGTEWIGAMLNEGDRVSAILMRRDGAELHELRIAHEEMPFADRPIFIGEMTAPAHLLRERDEWKARAEQAEQELRQARAEVAQAARTCRDIEHRLVDIQSMHEDTVRAQRRIEARHAPAVTRDEIENQLRIAYESGNHPIERIRVATAAVCDLFGIEAEQAVDPVEEKARELYRAATPDARWETVADEYRRIARHVLGQEAGSHE